MELVYTEIFLNKTIEVFRVNYEYFLVKINGDVLVPRGGGVSNGKYHNIRKAITSAKLSIKKNMSKADEIANIESEIARLQTRLKELKG